MDDNADALELLGTFLKACGAHVLEAPDARAALAYVDTTPGLDAIITELSMPGVDGVELARKVRRQPSRQGLPVIALTGFPERSSPARVCSRVDLFGTSRDGRSF